MTKARLLAALVAVTLIFGAAMALPAMLLWNWCLVPAVHVSEVTWVQMWGIILLVQTIAKSDISFKCEA